MDPIIRSAERAAYILDKRNHLERRMNEKESI